MNITIPQSAWLDYLDPAATTMEAELELPEPSYRKRGRGGTYLYEGVSEDVARELADYFASRAEMLLGQYDVDPSERTAHYAAQRVAERIRAALAPGEAGATP